MPLYAVCPYFQYEKRYIVGCELKPLVFSTYADKKTWMMNQCCSFDYVHCASAKKLSRRYEKMYDKIDEEMRKSKIK